MKTFRSLRLGAIAGLAALGLFAGSANAQMQSVDPDRAIDGDLAGEPVSAPAASYEVPEAQPRAYPVDETVPAGTYPATPVETATDLPPPVPSVATWDADTIGKAAEVAEAQGTTTYREDDLMGAAEGVFGKGAEGLADLIEGILSKQGEPNAYIVGREGGGAVAVGLRYGSGTLYHKVEGNRPVYWTGPSLGFDLGLNAGKAFVLVYNLYDGEDLFKRFGAGEGQAYLVGGFHVSYLRRGNIVLIPVRMGAGVRLGANIGYMKFSEKQRWLPF